MSRAEKRILRQPISWHSDILAADEENLSPLYYFYDDSQFERFVDTLGQEGWIVGEYASIKQGPNRPRVPAMLVVYYDHSGLATIDKSRISPIPTTTSSENHIILTKSPFNYLTSHI